MSNAHAWAYLKNFINEYTERIPSQYLNTVTLVTELLQEKAHVYIFKLTPLDDYNCMLSQ